MDHCIQDFIREEHSIADFFRIAHPDLILYACEKCGVEVPRKLTTYDLIHFFNPLGGRNRTKYDSPQIVTRTNQGLHDRKFLMTKGARARYMCGLWLEQEMKQKEGDEKEGVLQYINTNQREDNEMTDVDGSPLVKRRLQGDRGTGSNAAETSFGDSASGSAQEADDQDMQRTYLWGKQSKLNIVKDCKISPPCKITRFV